VELNPDILKLGVGGLKLGVGGPIISDIYADGLKLGVGGPIISDIYADGLKLAPELPGVEKFGIS
jgi:hypothetical protein